jgi:hypothetical protein
MGDQAFMLQDLAGALTAFCLFPLFLLVPGYSLGWLTDALSFRRRVLATRILLAVALSIAVFPALTYLVARLCAFDCVWVIYGVTWLVALVLIVRRARDAGPRFALKALLRDRSWAVPVVILSVWTGLALLSLVDLQVGGRLYFPIAVQDYAKHVAVTNAITRTGVPPVNPSFYPGHSVELFYYYFWFLLCSLVDRLGGSLVGPRHAVLGSTIWSGVALMAVLSLYVRFLGSDGHERARSRAIFAIALLLVSGLDLIPVLEEGTRAALAGHNIFRADPEWWNEQVTAWVGAVLWVPHHVASVLACLAGFLLFRTTQQTDRPRDRAVGAVVCGIAFSSALGLSIWVAFVFAIFLVVSVLLSLVRRRYAEVGFLVLAGFVSVLASAPYLLDLLGSSQLDTAPLLFAIRSFWPAETALTHAGVDNVWIHRLTNLALLPVNYAIELGFFVPAAILYWRRRLRRHDRLDEGDVAAIAMLCTSVLICTFLRSSIRNNDLGWRGFMFAQFILLLWSVDPAMALFQRLFRRRGTEAVRGFRLTRGIRVGLCLLLAIGAMTTLYEVAILRVYPVLADARVIGMPDWLGPDNRLGQRVYALRQTHRWISDELPDTAIVQHNPAVWKDLYGFYSERQVAVADFENGMLFGIPEGAFLAVERPVAQVFSADSDLAAVRDVCAEFSISVLLVKDVDPVWGNRQSWVWQREPVYGNDYARLFGCDALVAD